MTTIAFTVDLEPDCPPFLDRNFRGVEEGLPRLLDVLHEVGVVATFFTTGDVARRYPDAVRAVLDAGHELACHGMTHRAFTDLTPGEARSEIEESAEILRRHAPVTSFRAPYLRFPDAYLPILEENGFHVDSSIAGYFYKRSAYRRRPASSLRRYAASATSSLLRIPAALRNAYLDRLRSPVVLFVHPWEYVDLTREPLRLDCRFNTGEIAVTRLRESLERLGRRGGRFVRMRDLDQARAMGEAQLPAGHGATVPG